MKPILINLHTRTRIQFINKILEPKTVGEKKRLKSRSVTNRFKEITAQ